MQRTTIMTLGFLLIFLGCQFAIIDSYVLTTRATNLMSENGDASLVQQPTSLSENSFNTSPYRSVAYQQPLATVVQNQPNRRTITPPRWFCWPLLFCGTVVLLHGLSKPRRY